METPIDRIVELGKLITEGESELKREGADPAEAEQLRGVVTNAKQLFQTLVSKIYRDGAPHERVCIPVSILPINDGLKIHLIGRGISNLQTLWLIETGELLSSRDGSKYPFEEGKQRDSSELASIGVTLR